MNESIRALRIRRSSTSALFLGTAEEYNPTLEWEGFDLDGTLAYYDRYRGVDHIGQPIPKMVAILKATLARGTKVKIFTARAENPDAIPYVKAWLRLVGLPELEVTNVKDRYCTRIWDDKAVRVELNTGNILSGSVVS